MRRQWKNHFEFSPPDKRTIKQLFERFQDTGSDADLPRSVRPSTVTTQERLDEAADLITENPLKCVSGGTAAMGLARSTYHLLLQKLDLHPYRQRVLELLDDDMDRRTEFCDKMVVKLK